MSVIERYPSFSSPSYLTVSSGRSERAAIWQVTLAGTAIVAVGSPRYIPIYTEAQGSDPPFPIITHRTVSSGRSERAAIWQVTLARTAMVAVGSPAASPTASDDDARWRIDSFSAISTVTRNGRFCIRGNRKAG
jgi:uncharacterized membrane protein YhaH (DUF805 family)